MKFVFEFLSKAIILFVLFIVSMLVVNTINDQLSPLGPYTKDFARGTVSHLMNPGPIEFGIPLGMEFLQIQVKELDEYRPPVPLRLGGAWIKKYNLILSQVSPRAAPLYQKWDDWSERVKNVNRFLWDSQTKVLPENSSKAIDSLVEEGWVISAAIAKEHKPLFDYVESLKALDIDFKTGWRAPGGWGINGMAMALTVCLYFLVVRPKKNVSEQTSLKVKFARALFRSVVLFGVLFLMSILCVISAYEGFVWLFWVLGAWFVSGIIVFVQRMK